jgi:type-F conjugative transfer system secretin TraK
MRRYLWVIFSGWLLCVISLPSMASITVNSKPLSFTNNETLYVRLSADNVNRIAVKNDAITHNLCPQNLCAAQAHPDDASGGIYVSLLQSLPFTLQIATKAGRHVALQVIPTKGIGKTIILNPLTPVMKVSLFKHSQYTTLLTQLSNAMLNHRSMNGVSMTAVNNADRIPFYGAGYLQIKTIWQGDGLTGIEYRFHNRSKHMLTLSPSYFYKTNQRIASIALARQRVLPHAQTSVYVIKTAKGGYDE